MIGNDIIDLQIIASRPEWYWDRFRQKIMTEAEKQWLAPYRKNQLDIWIAWAIKESIYKLEFQFNPVRYFSPKTITCQSLNEGKGRFGKYPIALHWNRERLSALCWLATQKKPKHLIMSKKRDQLEPACLAYLSDQYPEKGFAIQRKPFPILQVDESTHWPLSMSHDGSWVAFAYDPI
jgi:phosphopantetheinyl transferase (holo-ACP synthase)